MKLLPLTPDGQTPIRVLTIAGTDSGGGAGIQADSRTMAMCGVHACVAVAAVTVQNSVGVSGFHEIPPQIVADQVRSVVGDIGVGAAKTGMLASTAIIDAVAEVCGEVGIGRGHAVPLVVDPVCASMHGDPLLHAEALDAVRHTLIPIASLVTPNLDEVRLITGIDVVDDTSARRAAEALHGLGAQWSLVKGGHLRTSTSSTDLLFDGDVFHEFTSPRIDTGNDHGGGDTLAAAIACALANGYPMPEAVAFGKEWVTRCLAASYDLGAGHGPVSPLWRLH
ncbi:MULTISPECIES: bifunctional hydroxymethylpyrimidine kinase/phosphomethylpyrimidine kinase [unclassified Rhodococcus (in: high G+C Gram-positive bacteria)]|uniref:bifunctional hydroxymethylpyrimidine kinase/phosphomethylpyrimidine kinase n=1 Tax=unclassified Rhodococcus (in: high G+C Gram-positive bacteria) TaxID=192944 RepID=UPI000BCB1DEF|nr:MULTISPECIES: bifunctional hydroxymethylpyrimidine kinase/phosphomethylpyrimidine kinase [unclassified Rhodococcus (in: high G+C Gram-positive bacteria)]MBP1162317.1 hydroxymethylpyrimidine/phosphomethylpyrimidine kinase [Rhodococcus sp. PvR099]PTR45030.1 hydroxymethylpyrimidine/phosphomethylpyrimidine kinase [Rhodococcus sp. OK611]SNX89365.1 hydroxymethylpyrimidine/phosphomethylpyrimidine kinase [Rhodococcus sp. OK270]